MEESPRFKERWEAEERLLRLANGFYRSIGVGQWGDEYSYIHNSPATQHNFQGVWPPKEPHFYRDAVLLMMPVRAGGHYVLEYGYKVFHSQAEAYQWNEDIGINLF